MSSNFFSNRLKALRNTHNIKQKDLASLLSVTIRTIVNYENGAREPSLADLICLADFFCVSMDYLVGRSDDPMSTHFIEKTEKELLEDAPEWMILVFTNYIKKNLPSRDFPTTFAYLKTRKKDYQACTDLGKKSINDDLVKLINNLSSEDKNKISIIQEIESYFRSLYPAAEIDFLENMLEHVTDSGRTQRKGKAHQSKNT